MGKIILILGGARSGKSGFAQTMASRLCAADPSSSATGAAEPASGARAGGERVTYLATATVKDEEMERRIARHRQSRPAEWRTVEESHRVARALSRETSAVVVVDCLTLLISNLLLEQGADQPDRLPQLDKLETAVMREIEDILRQARRIRSQVLLISNEVGLSVVPPTPLGRAFRDIAGRVNQRVAAEAEEVYFLLAGLAQKLK
jgi:adenosylcobinamide kinase/adenosylcobinamide-phosphate guanylyltransferase